MAAGLASPLMFKKLRKDIVQQISPANLSQHEPATGVAKKTGNSSGGADVSLDLRLAEHVGASPEATPLLARFAWLTLAYNIVVILWGAYVRATGSGASCGNRWPLCNGAVLPRTPQAQTIIEFTHRLTSGLAVVMVSSLLVWCWRKTSSLEPGRFQAAGVAK
jgi:hypothetical protein